MTKKGTVFVNNSAPEAEDLPSNREAQPISADQENKQQEEQAIAVSQLQNLAKDEQPVLMSLKTVFPFKLFPTEIIIEKTKVNIKNTLFFGSSDIQSLLISDISSCETESSMFFGLIRFMSRIPNAPPLIVNYLPKAEAQRARRIIQGLMVGVMNKVDVTKVSTPDLLESIEQVGDSKAAV
jgi:hypothetical protein